MSTINWRELMTTDEEKATAFYSELFNWKINAMDMPGDESMKYHVVSCAEQMIAGIMKGEAPVSYWLDYVTVTDVDAVVAKAKENGGNLIAGPFDVPTVGRSAVLTDSEGAAFAIMAYEGNEVPPPALDENNRPALHSFCWTQLMVDDVQKASDFYTSTLGWSAEPMMPGDDSQIVFKSGEAMIGSVMKNPNPQAPSNWLKYVAVEDIDVSAKRAETLGAQTMVPRTEIPQMGIFTIHVDPTGGVFALWQNTHA